MHVYTTNADGQGFRGFLIHWPAQPDFTVGYLQQVETFQRMSAGEPCYHFALELRRVGGQAAKQRLPCEEYVANAQPD